MNGTSRDGSNCFSLCLLCVLCDLCGEYHASRAPSTCYKTYRKYADPDRGAARPRPGVHEGEFLSVVGASGSGKSTLLHLLGTLDRPDKGDIHLDGRRIDNLPSKRRDQLRNQTFGFIFQFYHLLPELTTLENVLMPQMIAQLGVVAGSAGGASCGTGPSELLDRVGLGHRLHHKPRELSGGEMQRAAIARGARSTGRASCSPTSRPATSTPSNGDEIVDLLRDLNRRRG